MSLHDLPKGQLFMSRIYDVICLYDTSAVQSTNNAVIRAVLCSLLLDLEQELCSEELSGTGKANTHVCASMCPQQDSNTFPWKRVESYLNIKFPGGGICDICCVRNFNISLIVLKVVGLCDEWR
jgi:hypothetical protein